MEKLFQMKDYQMCYDKKGYYLKDNENNRLGDSQSVHLLNIKKNILQLFFSIGLIFVFGFLIFHYELLSIKDNAKIILLFFPLTLILAAKFWLIFAACIDIEENLYEQKKYQNIINKIIKENPEKMFLAKTMYDTQNYVEPEIKWELVD
jgi:hypothetical protein